MFNPSRFVELALLSGAIQERLTRIPCLTAEIIALCMKEVTDYRALAEDVDASTNLTAFWKRHTTDLPGWSSAFFLLGLIQPSSAASERGFSLFEALFGRNSLPQATEELMETQMKARMIHIDETGSNQEDADE